MGTRGSPWPNPRCSDTVVEQNPALVVLPGKVWMKRLITGVLVVVACTAVARSQEATVAVNFTDVQQRIDGFGASDAWNPPLSDAHADAFFSASTGIGLSILRVGIDPRGNNMSAYSNATKAAARGAIIWA